MKFCCVFLMLIISLTASAEMGSTSDVQGLYQEGVKAYQDGQLDQARTHFVQAVALDGKNKFLLYNWGLTEFHLNQKGQAIGAWRRALFIDPDFVPVQKALEYAKKEFQGSAFSNQLSAWEDFHNSVLVNLSMNKILFVTLLLLVLSGILLLKYFGLRKKALRDETPLPPQPVVGQVFFLGLVVALSLTLSKAYDSTITRATVVEKNVPVRTGPSTDDNSLFELLEGFEVIVRQLNGDWAQVTYPGGLTGWVPRQSIFHTSGRELW